MASMSILDDAIREHLELKRAHGADEAELKRLEDEAFGPPSRPEEPDPFAEAPTEFMTAPEAPEAPRSAAEESGGRRINIADRVIIDAEVKATPLGLLAIGGLVAALLLSVPPIIRAARNSAPAR